MGDEYMNLRAHFDDYKSTNILKNETLIENLYKQVEIRPNKTAVIDKNKIDLQRVIRKG